MKHLIILFFAALLSVTANAQRNGLPEFMNKTRQALDPASLAGIYTYETATVLDKIKVRRAGKRQSAAVVFDAYNQSVNGLRDENLESLVDLGGHIGQVVAGKDWTGILTARSAYRDRNRELQAVRENLHGELDASLQEALTRRQYRKWQKYRESHQEAVERRLDVGDLLNFAGL